jgi:dTDP-glucose 4,6-dehydratase
MPVPPLSTADLDHIVAHTRDMWEEARNQSFFITGGTGFFGMWLLESFAYANERLALNANAVVLTRHRERFFGKAPHMASRHDVRFVEGDVRSFEFPTGTFRYVVHAATESGTNLNAEAPMEMFDAIVEGTKRVINFADSHRTQKLLLTSSGAVYGPQPSHIELMPEDYPGGPDPLSPSSAYAEGKRVAEHLAAVATSHHQIELKVARCFAFVGPHLPLDAHFAVGNFLKNAIEGRPIAVSGDGQAYRSYLYSADLAIWLWTILFKGAKGRPYNVGSSSALSIGDLARLVSTEIGNGCAVTIARPAVAGSQPNRYVPSTTRATNELGLRARIELPDALRRTAAWVNQAEALRG